VARGEVMRGEIIRGEVIILPTERPIGHHLPPLRVLIIQLLITDHRCLLIIVDI